MNTETVKSGLRAAAEGVDSNIKTDVEALKVEIGRLRDDVAATARTAASLGKHGVEIARDKAGVAYETAKERVHTVAETAKQRASDAASYAKERGQEGVEKAEGTIKDHPFASVAVAFGAGLLLGALLRK